MTLLTDLRRPLLREPGGCLTAECAYCGATYEFAQEELDWDERPSE